VRLFYTDTFVLPLPAGHRFPMEKYARLRQALLASGDFSEADFQLPQAASDDELALAHDRDYIARVSHGQLSEKEQKAIGFPWSPAMVERSRRSAGATIGACRAALTTGVAGEADGFLFLITELTVADASNVVTVVRQRQFVVAGGLRQLEIGLGKITAGKQRLAQPGILFHRETMPGRQWQNEGVGVEESHGQGPPAFS
jgi:hypothetical protein